MISTTQHDNQLLLLRKRKNLSQKKAAAILGLRDPITLSHYERGTTLPPLITALRMQALYELPVHAIFAELFSTLRADILANMQGGSGAESAAEQGA